MIYTELELAKDINRITQIQIIPSLLDVICETTGMGFAAVARVTQDRWIACRVRDDIQFGLVTGGELKVDTTICDEIRDSHQPVIIDHVETNADFCNHHTPAMYGFQSYVSFPIILKNGEFFGTLCAIDPKPAQLNNSKIIGLFTAFADLISFHLLQVELLERSQLTLHTLTHQLTDSRDEIRQYRHISNHNLQEPLRKIRLFSGMLIDATEKNDVDKAKHLATRLDSSAHRLSLMVKDLSGFSELNDASTAFEEVDLTELIAEVNEQLSQQINAKKATIQVDIAPSVQLIAGVRLQLEQLFYHLLHNALKFSRKDVVPSITIAIRELPSNQLPQSGEAANEQRFVDIQITDNGIGIAQSQLEKIFDIFSQVPLNKVREGEGIGLAYCRKIVRNHSGNIMAQSEVGQGTTFSVHLPLVAIA